MRLLAIDISNLIVRHSANPYGTAVDDAGRPVHGAIGALAQIARTVNRLQPTHLLIARDGRRQDSLRRQLDPAYKAHRSEADDDIRHQFSVTWAGVELLGWPYMASPGHEADDIIASAASNFPGRADILTGDRDMLALCSDRVTVLLLRPGGEVEVDAAGCLSLTGVRPDQLTDYKALVGDSSDGIRGIRGVGPKSAQKLLERYDNLDRVWQIIDQGEELEGISPAIAKKIAAGREEADLSYKLAKLVCDLPIDFDSLACPSDYNDQEFGEELDKLGLHELRSRLSKKPAGPISQEVDLEDHFKNIFS